MGLKEYAKKQWHMTKATFAAWFRQGAKEAAQMLQAFPSQGVQVVEEAGTFLNPTSHEVYNQKHLDKKYEQVLEQQQRAAKKTAKRSKGKEPEPG